MQRIVSDGLRGRRRVVVLLGIVQLDMELCMREILAFTSTSMVELEASRSNLSSEARHLNVRLRRNQGPVSSGGGSVV